MVAPDPDSRSHETGVPLPSRLSRHSGETTELLRVSLLAGVPTTFFAWIYVDGHGGATALGVIPAAAIMIGVPIAAITAVWTISRFVGGLAGRHWAGGGKPAPRGFSMEEAAVAQGRIADAERMYRNAIFEEPASCEARLRLAGLLVDLKRDLEEAEVLYLEVRQLDPTPADEVAVYNGLLDLYRVTGRSEDFDAELQRFTERFSSVPGVPTSRQHR